MGNCWSSRVSATATAKLILTDDKLEEFAHPVKVSHVLQRNPQCFVCNSDEMDFDRLLSAVDEKEELRPGQLYFVLPVTWLSRRLQPEDMARLAVKASVALRRNGGERYGCCNFGRVDSVAFFDDETELESRGLVVGPSGGGGGGYSGGKRGKFNTNLSVIIEDE